MHAAAGLGFIAKAKPELETKITNALLMLDYEKTKHPNLLRSVAVGSFIEYKPRVRQVTEFVEKLVNSDSPKARKLAKEYLKVARNGTQ